MSRTPAPGYFETEEMGPRSSALRIGQSYAEHFQIATHLADGGMATLYFAIDTRSNQLVAFKILHRDFQEHGPAREQFDLEGEILCACDSPAIPKGYARGIDPIAGPWLAMELLEGKTLADFDRGFAWSGARVCALGAEIADAMASVHYAGILHLDLKPENLFVVRRGTGIAPKILDWGLARVLSRQPIAPGERVARGTARYMSPEQFRGEPLGPCSDVYSLCVVLYELLAHRFPYGSDSEQRPNFTTAQYRAYHLHGDLVPLPTLNREVSELVWAAIQPGLQRLPQSRYESMTQLAKALRFAERDLLEKARTRMMRADELGSLVAEMDKVPSSGPLSELPAIYRLGVATEEEEGAPSTTLEMPSLLRDPLDSTAIAETQVGWMARLVALDGPLKGRAFDLDAGPFVLGRGAGSTILVDAPGVEVVHAEIVVTEGGVFVLVDRGSASGTFVGGQRLKPQVGRVLQRGDRIEVGGAGFEFRRG